MSTYRDSGVDVEAGDAAVERIRSHVASTVRPGVLGGVGGFGGLFDLAALRHYRDPLLVSSTDGVGTKALLAADLGVYDTLGYDLVAMCADDLVCTGAEPLFFLDYVLVGRLDPLGQEAVALDGPDAEPGQVDLAVGQLPRVLGHFTADQGRPHLAAGGGDPGHHLLDQLRVEPPDQHVVEEEERLGARAHQVVGAHGH